MTVSKRLAMRLSALGCMQYSLAHSALCTSSWRTCNLRDGVPHGIRTVMKSPIAVVVLAAGAGTRMKSALHKVLHPLAGWPMVRHVLDNVERLKPSRIIGVVSPGAKDVAAAFAPHRTVVQSKPLGTGHAAKAALGALKGIH